MINKKISKKSKLKKHQQEEINHAFDLFDGNGNGKIDFSELRCTLKALGFEVEKKDILEIMDEFDPEESGYVCYEDYLTISKLNSDSVLSDEGSSGRSQDGFLAFRGRRSSGQNNCQGS